VTDQSNSAEQEWQLRAVESQKRISASQRAIHCLRTSISLSPTRDSAITRQQCAPLSNIPTRLMPWHKPMRKSPIRTKKDSNLTSTTAGSATRQIRPSASGGKTDMRRWHKPTQELPSSCEVRIFKTMKKSSCAG
jgi:hypothetical protein